MSKQWQAFYQTEAKCYNAQRYHSWYGALFARLHHNFLREVMSGCAKDASILDLACGTGHNLAVLLDYGRLVVACDLTSAMVQEAIKQYKGEKLVYTLGNALQLPFPDNTFDVVASSRFLHLFPESQQQLCVREMNRILKPGGLLIVDFYNRYQWLFLSPFIALYRAIKCKRPTEDTLNTIFKVKRWMAKQDLTMKRAIGVGSYFLILARFLPDDSVFRLGRLFGRPPFRILSEQFIVVAQKRL
ncbi:MAG: methyltransferase domain-containing protein [Deltaproteobacteria bacterium]|nr:methyltransferase domain-containing protein [Deltaproteobacteria bacterium]